MRRTAMSLLAVLVAISATVVGFGGPAAGATRHASRVSAALSSSTVTQGKPARLSGTVSPRGTGRAVFLDRYSSGRWRSIARTTTSRTGYYRFALATTRAATTSYRARVLATSRLRGASSVARRLTVRPRVVPTPLEGPFEVESNGDGKVLAREVTGLHRAKVVGAVTGDSWSTAAVTPGGRILMKESVGGSTERLTVQGMGLTRRSLALTSASTCLGWEALSPDGTYAAWGIGSVGSSGAGGGFSLCYPPRQLRVQDVVTGVVRVLDLPSGQNFGTLRAPAFTRDGRYVVVTGHDDSYVRVSGAFDTGTGARVMFSGLTDVGDYTITDLPAPSGAFVAKGPVTVDSPSGLWTLTAGSQQPPVPWGTGTISPTDADRITASPSGNSVAWLRSVGGAPHVVVAPSADLGSVTDLGPLGYTVTGNAQFLNWVGEGLLSVQDNGDHSNDSGGNVRDARTGRIAERRAVGAASWMN